MTRTNNEAAPGTFAFEIGDAFTLLRQRPLLISCVAVIVAGLGVLFALSLPNRFEALATVLIDPRTKNIVDIENVLSGIEADTPTIESELEIIRSRAIAGRVIDRLGLARDPEFNGSRPSFVQRMADQLGLGGAPIAEDPSGPVAATASDVAYDDAIFDEFADRLYVARRRNTYVIEIFFQSENSVKSAQIATALAEAYLEDQVEAKVQAAETATIWLERRLRELRGDVQDAEAAVQAFKAQNDLVITEGFLLDERELARLVEQLTFARGAAAEARAKFRQVERMLEDPSRAASVADVLESHTVSRLRAIYGDATRKMAELETRYGTRHPALQQARAEEADARVQLVAEIQRIVTNVESEAEVADAREATLAQRVRELRARKVAQNTDTVDLRQLEHEADSARDIYNTFLKRYRETTGQRELQLPDARLVERATVPQQLASPKRKQIAILAAGVGLGLGLLLAVVAEFFFPRISRDAVVAARSGVAVFATVPSLRPEGQRSNLLMDHSGAHADVLHDLRLSLLEPHHEYCDGVRQVRQMLDRRRSADTARMIVVGDADAAVARAMLSSNLAHQYARAGLETLLLDAALTAPALTEAFLPQHTAGFVDILAGTALINDAIVRDSSSGLSFLPASAGRPANLQFDPFGTVLAAHVIDALRDRFDVIIADTGDFTVWLDSVVLAGHGQQSIVVAPWSTRTVAALQAQGRAFAQANLTLTGCVVDNGAYRVTARSVVADVDRHPAVVLDDVQAA